VPEHVEQEAATWAVRHPLSLAERHALDAWLARDPRHAGALLRAQAALSRIDDAILPDRSLPVGLPSPTRWFTTTRRRLVGGIGGAMAAAIAGVVAWPRFRGERVSTAQGEVRRLPLADGSVATIDTDSDLRIELAQESRRIALARGQAWFQVVKDRRRPFIVDAGAVQARAVGTAFSVRRTPDGVQVAVTEGTVATWPTEASGAMTILHAGQFATFTRGGTDVVTGTAPAAIERALAWRNGEISLEDETLGSAVAQFNRYNRQRLVLDDDGLARERLVGLFQIDKPADFAKTLEAMLDVSVTVTAAEIHVRPKNDRPTDGVRRDPAL